MSLPVTITLSDEQLDELALAIRKRLRLMDLPQNLDDVDIPNEPTKTAVYAVYHGHRIDAWYLNDSQSIIIGGISMGHFTINKLINNQTPLSVSGAAKAVVSALNPSVDPNRNGYTFWRLTGTDEMLESIR